MECNKEEAIRAKAIAENKFLANDVMGAKKFALKASKLYPELEGISQMLATIDVYVSAENRVNGEVNVYGILGVSPQTDESTIRKQYLKLALILHPDKNKSVGADGAFKHLSEAWSLLSDKSKKSAYDHKNADTFASQQPVKNPKKNATSNRKNPKTNATSNHKNPKTDATSDHKNPKTNATPDRKNPKKSCEPSNGFGSQQPVQNGFNNFGTSANTFHSCGQPSYGFASQQPGQNVFNNFGTSANVFAPFGQPSYGFASQQPMPNGFNSSLWNAFCPNGQPFYGFASKPVQNGSNNFATNATSDCKNANTSCPSGETSNGFAPEQPVKNGFNNSETNASSRMKPVKDKGTKRRSPSPSLKQERNTFWTVCSGCKMQHKYCRMFLNIKATCSNCHLTFSAVETAPPSNGSKRFTESNYSDNSNVSSDAQAATSTQRVDEKVKCKGQEEQTATEREETIQRQNRSSKRAHGNSSSAGSSSAAKKSRVSDDQSSKNCQRRRSSSIRLI